MSLLRHVARRIRLSLLVRMLPFHIVTPFRSPLSLLTLARLPSKAHPDDLLRVETCACASGGGAAAATDARHPRMLPRRPPGTSGDSGMPRRPGRRRAATAAAAGQFYARIDSHPGPAVRG